VASWFNKERQGGSLLALCSGEHGVAAAAVSQAPAQTPVLEWAEFLAVEGSAAARRGALANLLKLRRSGGQATTSVMPIPAATFFA